MKLGVRFYSVKLENFVVALMYIIKLIKGVLCKIILMFSINHIECPPLCVMKT